GRLVSPAVLRTAFTSADTKRPAQPNEAARLRLGPVQVGGARCAVADHRAAPCYPSLPAGARRFAILTQRPGTGVSAGGAARSVRAPADGVPAEGGPRDGLQPGSGRQR